VAAVGILGGGGLVGLGMTSDSGGSLPLAGTFLDAPASSPTPTGPSPEELAKQERARRVKALDGALKKHAAAVPEFSIAVLDAKTGERYSYRGSERYETASVVKVQVLACLLLTAQDDDRKLSANESALAERMIRLSDNDATTSLFSRLGGSSGITRCNKRLGLRATKVNSAWGLTRTTVDDQVRLLAELVDKDGPLNAGSRKQAFKLMNTVDPEQQWGVPAVAAESETTTVKDGWLPRSTEGGRWIINSVGRVTGDDVDVSIAVLSHGHATMPDGIAAVEKAAKLTRQHLKY
jgi:Beta-lactamase enzyme family